MPTRKSCPPDHKHGATRNCYNSHGCRCEDCTTSITNAQRDYRKAKAYGRWTSPLVDAEPAREHVQRLREYGIGVNRIGRIANFPMIGRLIYGPPTAPGQPRVPLRRIDAEKARRILAVRPTIDLIADGARIPARGTHRRLQALVAHGWSQMRLSYELGLGPNEVNRLLRTSQVSGRTHRSVAQLFDRLWQVPPPEGTTAQRTTYRRALTLARANGWVPALAWDDIDLDDAPPAVDDLVDEAAVMRAIEGEQTDLTPKQRREAVEILHARGLNDKEIAARIHCSDRTVLRIRHDELGLTANVHPRAA
ncbi:plasmid maintenance system antidote protein VapI [Curtobacterium sp. 320]|uniref:hypothetical protein n=1 Tax=Curtobacterium sp. 320 TaxID=2817749 RepID=UPI00285DB094|nr:hypothetical protein [Curtobacterium sp. 320]MDR6574321.1 plasmid maintenance system antidote protein VapI [Curtobacterium sp. 320]